MSNFERLTAYVDGSYNSKTQKFGGACVLEIPGLEANIEKTVTGDNTNHARLRNVAGEIYAAIMAISIAQQLGTKHLILNYDYSGLELWTRPASAGGWRAKNKLSQEYQAVVVMAREGGLNIEFVHTPAHTGILGNERADKLAKEACK